MDSTTQNGTNLSRSTRKMRTVRPKTRKTDLRILWIKWKPLTPKRINQRQKSQNKTQDGSRKQLNSKRRALPVMNS